MCFSFIANWAHAVFHGSSKVISCKNFNGQQSVTFVRPYTFYFYFYFLRQTTHQSLLDWNVASNVLSWQYRTSLLWRKIGTKFVKLL